MALRFQVSTFIPAPPETVYKAWLTSKSHAAMTGGAANVNARVGATFQAWDGYISGRNLELEPGARIVQAWRTSEFTETEPDSRLEILFKPKKGGTTVTIKHSGLPAHGMQYRQGWIDAYYEPMKAFFTTKTQRHKESK